MLDTHPPPPGPYMAVKTANLDGERAVHEHGEVRNEQNWIPSACGQEASCVFLLLLLLLLSCLRMKDRYDYHPPNKLHLWATLGGPWRTNTLEEK